VHNIVQKRDFTQTEMRPDWKKKERRNEKENYHPLTKSFYKKFIV